MKTIFVGGSRHISRLPAEIKQRLNTVLKNGHHVIVGDANGADKAVQKYLLESAYDKVTVFCSGDSFRNNLGSWRTRHVSPQKHVTGFQFYAAKDREMAREADFGLMIWDGKSAGTVLNVLRLIRAGKIAVLINVPEKSSLNIKSIEQWEAFLTTCSSELKSDLRARATPDEWRPAEFGQPSLLAPLEIEFPEPNAREAPPSQHSPPPSGNDVAVAINAALESGDPAFIVDAIGNMARLRGMTQVARDTGLARESLYRSLSNGGNPEFATVLKVLAAMGLRLEAKPAALKKRHALQSA
ncbi:MAG TPA: addiction module antidote protein [Beijerinckiaceae bacterium]|nr:addiction module antidote protein [Beijerinckiaceae bacterium]